MNVLASLLGLLILLVLIAGCTKEPGIIGPDERAITSQSLLEEKLAVTEQAAAELLEMLPQEGPEEPSASFLNTYQRARVHFKEVEFILAYHYPGLAKKLNGPALPKIEDYDPNATIIDPEGFQVLEELLFAGEPVDQEAIDVELRILKANVKRIRQYNDIATYTDRHTIESIRLGLVRLLSLGLSGFDSPVAQASIPESVVVLRGMRAALRPYINDASSELGEQIIQAFIASESYLKDHSNSFENFDRLAFIREYANPLSESIYELGLELDIEKPPVPKPLNNTKTVFEANAFNAAFFAPPYAGELTQARVDLGRTLFFDPLLSGNNQRSCASCHRPSQAFSDGLPQSVGFGFDSPTVRNAPTLINAGLQASSSYDLKTIFVEDRVSKVFENERELHTSISTIIAKLKHSPEYDALLKEAFGPAETERELGQHIRIAISDYVRSLEGMNSPFDRYIRGESQQLDPAAKRGFNLFMGKALCGTCHFMPLFNGVVPPDYGEHEAEIIGVPEQPDTLNAVVDSDEGKYILYNYDLHRFSFKTPTVRNAALTAPYMHNGVYETLEEVIDFYNRGGGAGIGIELEYQTLPPDPLNLDTQDISDLVAFMEALTDTSGLTQTPNELPVVYDPQTNTPIKRIIGGVY